MENSEKLQGLFNFVASFTKLSRKRTYDLSKIDVKRNLRDIRENKYIKQNDFELKDFSDDLIFTFKYADIIKCPQPEKRVFKWLNDGWDSPIKEKISLKNEIVSHLPDGTETTILFDESEDISLVNNWIEKRQVWYEEASEQYYARQQFDYFHNLYREYRKKVIA